MDNWILVIAWNLIWEHHRWSHVCLDLDSCQGPVSISDKMSCKISQRLEAARFVFRIVRSLWNLTGTLTALLPRCLSNFKVMWWFKLSISWLRDFTRSYDKTSNRILKRDPDHWLIFPSSPPTFSLILPSQVPAPHIDCTRMGHCAWRFHIGSKLDFLNIRRLDTPYEPRGTQKTKTFGSTSIRQ